MSRKKQNIKIEIHLEENIERIFSQREIDLFWELKIAALIKNSGVKKEEICHKGKNDAFPPSILEKHQL